MSFRQLLPLLLLDSELVERILVVLVDRKMPRKFSKGRAARRLFLQVLTTRRARGEDLSLHCLAGVNHDLAINVCCSVFVQYLMSQGIQKKNITRVFSSYVLIMR